MIFLLNYRITTPEGKDIIIIEIIGTSEVKEGHPLYPILEHRRELFLTGCPREYQYLADIDEWYYIKWYREELDSDRKLLMSLLDSRARLVLMENEAVCTLNGPNNTETFSSFKGDESVGAIQLEDSDILLVYPNIMGGGNSPSYLSQIVAGDMNKRALSSKDPVRRDIKLYYSDDIITRLMSDPIDPIVAIKIMTKGSATKEGVLVRRVKNPIGEQAMWLPLEKDKSNGKYLVKINDLEPIRGLDIILLGDLILYDGTKYLVTEVSYDSDLENIENHLLTIVNLRTLSSMQVSMVEVRRAGL